MATLKLTLKRAPFDIMITGEKKEEFRRKSKWIMSRLDRSNREPIEFVKFTNGYKKDSPSFTVEYYGWEMVESINKTYSNGLVVKGDKLVCIKLGNLI